MGILLISLMNMFITFFCAVPPSTELTNADVYGLQTDIVYYLQGPSTSAVILKFELMQAPITDTMCVEGNCFLILAVKMIRCFSCPLNVC